MTNSTTIGPAELAAIIRPWGDSTSPLWTQRVLRAREVLHQHIRTHCGRRTMFYIELGDAIGWRGRGAHLGNLLDAVAALDHADGLPPCTAIVVEVKTGRPSAGCGWSADEAEHHQRMIARCWMAYGDRP